MEAPRIPTKQELIDDFGLTQAEIARLTKTTRSAVAQWQRDKPIPERRWLILRYEARPDLFTDAA